jgi:hypothetical protein
MSQRPEGEGYHYDMNSQYPNDMKFNMPTVNPVFSNNTNLNYYNLGFVFARITTPSKDILPNLFIQRRNDDGSVSSTKISELSVIKYRRVSPIPNKPVSSIFLVTCLKQANENISSKF